MNPSAFPNNELARQGGTTSVYGARSGLDSRGRQGARKQHEELEGPRNGAGKKATT